MLVIDIETSIMIGSPEVGNPAASGFGVMNGVVPPCGTTAATVGIRAFDDHGQALVGRALQIRGEAGDVMRAADDDGAGAALARHRRGALERRAASATGRAGARRPRFPRGAAPDDLRLARFRHRALVDLGEIRREQREAVRRVAEQVGVEQDVGDVARDVGAHAGAIEQCCARKRASRRRESAWVRWAVVCMRDRGESAG